MSPISVLLVDDNSFNREGPRLYLQREGFVVLEAGDEQSALELAERVTVHAAVIDISIPPDAHTPSRVQHNFGIDLARQLELTQPALGIILFPLTKIGAATRWKTVCVPWYDGRDKTLEIVTAVSLWYQRGIDPVRLRWVLVSCPDNTLKPTAFFCSDPTVSADQILRWFVCRWNIEVTFEELRAQLGFETQRQWSERAIERTASCLFGLFSVIAAMAKTLHPKTLPLRETSWYHEEEATFSDALAAVRGHLWASFNSSASLTDADLCLIPRPMLEALQQVACYST